MVTRRSPAKAEGEETETETEGSEDSIVETVRKVVGETLGGLFDSGKADVVDTAEKPAKAEGKGLTLRDVEETAARMIREAQDAIKPKSKAAPEPEKAKPSEPEKAPEKRNILRELLWGKDREAK